MANDLIASLAKSRGFPRVSIYLPMAIKGDTNENPIRLKNALKEVAERLEESGLDAGAVEALLSEAHVRLEDSVFWRYQNRGLAIFIEPEATRFVKLPEEPPERVAISTYYNVLPLITIFGDKARFHLLAVTRDEAKLYEVRRHEIHAADILDMPAGIESVREQTEFQEARGYHFRAGAGASGTSQPVGHGVKGDTPEDYLETLLEHYARDIARAIEPHLGRSHAPLVLAAEPRLLGRLREAISYPYLAKEAIGMDPLGLTEDQLRELSYEIAHPLMSEDRQLTESRLRAWVSGDPEIKAGRSFEDLWRATSEGRLATLFLADREALWGRVDEATGVPLFLDKPEPGSEDLLNLLALRTIEQGGDVLSLPDDVRSEVGPMAGLYRY